MRRLLLFSLLCGLGALASATPYLSIEGSTVCVGTDHMFIYNGYSMYDTVITWSSWIDPCLITDGPIFTGTGSIDDFGIDFWPMYGLPDAIATARLRWIYISGKSELIQPGIHYAAQFAGLQFGRSDYGLGRIDLLETAEFTVIDTVYVVPEPATLMLLAMGGWWIRKR